MVSESARFAIRRLRKASSLLVLIAASASPAYGQELAAVADAGASVVWYVDGHAESAPVRVLHRDSLASLVVQAESELHREGYYFARVDSVIVDPLPDAPVRFFITRGPQLRVATLTIEGSSSVGEDRLRDRLVTRPGGILDRGRLENDVSALLALFDEAGYALAAVQVRVEPSEAHPERCDVTLVIHEGRPVILRGVELEGGGRSRSAFLLRLLDLKEGQVLKGFRPGAMAQRLRDTGLFREVGAPELIVLPDTSAILRIHAVEEPPGSFDLVLGYQPASAQGQSGLAGTGHITLNNLFGSGKAAMFRFNRLPGHASRLDFAVSDPFLAGLPLAAELRFQGIQQDSLYGQQRLGGELALRVSRGASVFATLSREATQPGFAGAHLVAGEQRVSRSDGWFAGFGARHRRVDDRVNPRRGILAEMAVERGRKERQGISALVPGDTSLQRSSVQQVRARVSGRVFIPTLRRQVLAAGFDAAAVSGEFLDVADLIRFGGAASLRGYDEDRFRAEQAGRFLLEYRLLLDPTSHAFLFADLGYVRLPPAPGVARVGALYPGYGLGIQMGTALGIVQASYAFSPDSGPADGRIHVGLSFGM
jgi:outer membrane protein assembly factor BamA